MKPGPYQRQAEEIRESASQISDSFTRKTLLKIATIYDELDRYIAKKGAAQ